MNCPQCGGSQISIEVTSAGLMSRCITDGCGCSFRTGSSEQAQQHHAPVAPPVQALTRPAVEQTAQLIQGRQRKPHQAVTRVDVIRLAKAQLRELNQEISRLKKLEKQRDALKRLLAAADKKPEGQAVVRALRTNTGR